MGRTESPSQTLNLVLQKNITSTDGKKSRDENSNPRRSRVHSIPTLNVNHNFDSYNSKFGISQINANTQAAAGNEESGYIGEQFHLDQIHKNQYSYNDLNNDCQFQYPDRN